MAMLFDWGMSVYAFVIDACLKIVGKGMSVMSCDYWGAGRDRLLAR